MKKKSEHIIPEESIVRFLDGALSESEKEEFENWLNEEDGNQKIFDQTKKIWNHSRNIGAIQSIVGKEDWTNVQKRITYEGRRTSKSSVVKRNLILFRRIAALIILVVGTGFLTKHFLFTTPNYISFTTGNFKDEVILPDGSNAFLNEYSELKYPEKFKRNSRLVVLNGEAYFEVTKDPDRLFQIDIDSQAFVEVLGTSFNLRSDKEKGFVNISVVTGRVAFFTTESYNNKTILLKDEAATLNNGIISKDITRNNNFLSWKTGVLSFENDNIDRVFNTLTLYYNKKFTLSNTDSEEIRFTSRFDNQDLESVLEEMKLVLNLDYTLAGDSIIFNKRER